MVVLPAAVWMALIGNMIVSEPERPLTVCVVLADLASYKDRMVSVRGELLRTEEGTYLTSERCAKPLVTAGYIWPNPVPIDLIPADSRSAERPDAPPRPVSTDAASAELLRRFGPDSSARIFVTVVGKLETRSSFEIVLRGDGKRVPYGYGHLNACPAQLVYQVVKDVVVKRSPPSK